MTHTVASAEAYRAIYHANAAAILGFALRRTATAEDAADVLAETMLVAWRRFGECPDGEEARLWLYGVARRILANHHRGESRRQRLGARFAAELAIATSPDVTAAVDTDVWVRKALSTLHAEDQDLLTLTLWEGLEPREVAAVLGLTPQVVRTRLHRARGKLRAALGEIGGDDRGASGHVLGDGQSPVREEEQR